MCRQTLAKCQLMHKTNYRITYEWAIQSKWTGHTSFYYRVCWLASSLLFITKWAAQISRERFERGPPNFTDLSWTIGLTNMPDNTLLAASSRLWNVIKYCTQVHKTGPKLSHLTAHGRISPEWFKKGLQNFTSLSGTVSPTNLPDMTSLASSSRLQKSN